MHKSVLPLQQYLIGHIVYVVIDKNIHLNLIKEIQYFYIRGLIDESELIRLKEQYLRYMDFTEKIITKGTDPNGSSYDIYLSMLGISSRLTLSVMKELKT